MDLSSDKSKQRKQEEQFFCDDISANDKEMSVMISDNKADQSVISKLQQQIEQLEHEKKSLEIDNVCLRQQNDNLKDKIDDVATHFPKASILLGKNPDETKRKKSLKIRFKK
jgi:hypothetical protein